MKRLATFTACSAAILMAFCLVGLAQNAPAPPAQQAPAVQEKTFEGHLTKVDAAANLITVKGADDKEMSFSYNDQTQMVGVEKGPQGLTGKTGSSLKIWYRENRGANLASKIEVQGPAPAK